MMHKVCKKFYMLHEYLFSRSHWAVERSQIGNGSLMVILLLRFLQLFSSSLVAELFCHK